LRKRFEMVKAVGAASHAEVLGGQKVRKGRRAFELAKARQLQGCSIFASPNVAG